MSLGDQELQRRFQRNRLVGTGRGESDYGPPGRQSNTDRMEPGSNGPYPEATLVPQAAEAVSSASAPLPHFDRIQQSFGKHDVSHVRT